MMMVEVPRWARDFACGLPLVACGDSFTPAKRLKFDSGPRLHLSCQTSGGYGILRKHLRWLRTEPGI